MAGGALGGVAGAALRLIPSYSEDWIRTPIYANDVLSQVVSAVLFLALCGYVWWRSQGRAAAE
jgi:hypothetical protein